MHASAKNPRLDTRVTAMLSGTMRDGHGSRPVRVGDLSPTGLLVVCNRPPSRGDIVDINIGGHHIVAEARWQNGRRCGMRASQRIDVQAILSGKPPKKRFKAKKIEEVNDPSAWATNKVIAAYGLLGLTAFSTAYLIAYNFIL